MKKTESTITTWDRLTPGCRIALDGEDLLWVVTTTGEGPYTSTVRRRPTLRIRAALAWAWLTAPYRDWRTSRCYGPFEERDTFCFRRATFALRCDRHALEAIEYGQDL